MELTSYADLARAVRGAAAYLEGAEDVAERAGLAQFDVQRLLGLLSGLPDPRIDRAAQLLARADEFLTRAMVEGLEDRAEWARREIVAAAGWIETLAAGTD